MLLIVKKHWVKGYYWDISDDGFVIESTNYFASPQDAIEAWNQTAKKLGITYEVKVVAESYMDRKCTCGCSKFYWSGRIPCTGYLCCCKCHREYRDYKFVHPHGGNDERENRAGSAAA